ncbi:MAG: hypothetical protein IVW57_08810, partial [Ktedonobacterales bacterium]|nr:hypothetical protein [Ktedonobacterales bacterium]
MRGPTTDHIPGAEVRRAPQRARATTSRSPRSGRVAAQAALFPPGEVHTTRDVTPRDRATSAATMPALPAIAPAAPTPRRLGMGTATAMPGLSPYPYISQTGATAPDPDVWLIAAASAGGGMRPLEGAGRAGAIRVGRPYGHLRSVRPVLPSSALEESLPRARRSRAGGAASTLPAPR